MTLAEYLGRNGLTQKAFGARAGIEQSYVSRILAGAPISGTTARRIYTATGGAVTPNDLLLRPGWAPLCTEQASGNLPLLVPPGS
jgi:transcriptional regulator with XRE-family HTH domain